MLYYLILKLQPGLVTMMPRLVMMTWCRLSLALCLEPLDNVSPDTAVSGLSFARPTSHGQC